MSSRTPPEDLNIRTQEKVSVNEALTEIINVAKYIEEQIQFTQ